jgi:hypothetical protein
MEAALIAPCGVNCGICKAHLRKNKRCLGCLIKRSVHIACVIYNCEKLKTIASGYCYECKEFPCRKIKHLDERHRRKMCISNIENLGMIKEKGVAYFLQKEEEKLKGLFANKYKADDWPS